MSDAASMAERIARAVLYEGHMLYPYRRSALKNRQPWSFGTLAPEKWVAATKTDPCCFRAECLVNADASARLAVLLRFLHLGARPSREAGEQGLVYGESIERTVAFSDVTIGALMARPARLPFSYPASTSNDPACAWRELTGELTVTAEPRGCAIKVVVSASNTTHLGADASRDEALLTSLVAAHAALQLHGGEFVSLLDPASEFAAIAAECRNHGVFPVLIGNPEQRDQMLASPIILYDYPEVAPESPGDFFDATEMDEMLALRVLTLTDDEKQEMRTSGAHARAILERTESMPAEQLLKVHGVIRGLRKTEEPR